MVKKIHYCWFGGSVPDNVAANVEAWKRLNPDFEFREWNEGNTDVNSFEFGRRALEQKRWAFLADIVRLQKLFDEGGFYLDTDVELIRPLRELNSEEEHFTLGYMYACTLGTAVLYSPKGHPHIGNILEEYHHIRPEQWPVNNVVFTDYFINRVPGFRLNGRFWQNQKEKITLYPKEFFEHPCLRRERGISIHHFSGSWMPKNIDTPFQTASTDSHKIKWLKRKIRTFFELCRSEYLPTYLRAVFLNHPSTVPMWWRE